jgi:hypothetical protein
VARVGDYNDVIVESFVPSDTSGRHGAVHLRPLAGQGLSTALFVECSKTLSRDYPVGSLFKIRAKLTDRDGGGEYLYSYHGWVASEVSPVEADLFIKSHGRWIW